MMTTRLESLSSHADEHYNAIRAIGRATSGPRSIPAPTVYAILGNLKTSAGHGVEAVLIELADRLRESITDYAVYDRARDPQDSIDTATALMVAAGEHAAAIGDLLERAQVAINQQGYNTPEPAS
jgi:hypothetical protein